MAYPEDPTLQKATAPPPIGGRRRQILTAGAARLEALAGRLRSLDTFASLQYRDFRYLWFGTVFMSAGLWIQQVTLGWFLYDLTNSPVLLGLLNGLNAIPFLVFSLVAGIVADRMDRRHLLLMIQPVIMVSAFGLGWLIVSGRVQVWHLFAFALIAGTGWSFTQPIRQTLVPSVVPKEQMMNAVALTSVGFNITKVLGPALGGLLIAWVGAGGNFFLQAATYSGVFLMIYRMYVPPFEAEARRASVFENLREGLRFVWKRPEILAVMIVAQVPQLFATPYLSLMPVFQKDVLQVGPQGLGFLMAAPGVGGVISLLLLASLANRYPYKGRLLLVGLVVLGVFLILFSRMTAFPLALLMLVGVGACQLIYLATSNTMLQLLTPEVLRGRVMSIYMLNRGIGPLGSMVAGVSTAAYGAPATVSAMGVLVILLVVFVAWKFPNLYQVAT